MYGKANNPDFISQILDFNGFPPILFMVLVIDPFSTYLKPTSLCCPPFNENEDESLG
jgi:hypothetical protein